MLHSTHSCPKTMSLFICAVLPRWKQCIYTPVCHSSKLHEQQRERCFLTPRCRNSSTLFFSFLLFLTAHASAVWLFNVLWENHNNQCYVNVRVPYVYFLRNYHNLYQFKIIHRAWQRREGGKDAAVCCVFSLDFFLWSRRRAHAAHD